MLIKADYKFISGAVILKKTIYNFSFCITAIAVLSVLCIFYKFNFSTNDVYFASFIWNPIWLFFGPLAYFAHQALSGNKPKPNHILMHSLPFLIALFCYGLVIFFNVGQESVARQWYNNMNIMVPFSLCCYSVYILVQQITKYEQVNDLLFIICGFLLVIALLQLFIYLSYVVLQLDMRLYFRFFRAGFLLIMVILIMANLYLKRTKKSIEDSLVLSKKTGYINSTLQEDKALFYKNEICNYFETSQAYLRSDISLDVLEKELNIPKHLFSQIFNVYIGVNFYTFVANYRIDHALKLIDTHKDKITVEYMAYECGFNSKTSFNKYFKAKTGLTPYKYINSKVN